jgi:two-component system, NtrC family, sensor kinase
MRRTKVLNIFTQGLTVKFVLVTILAVLAVMAILGILFTVYERKTLDTVKGMFKEGMIKDYKTTEEALLALGSRSISDLGASLQDRGTALARLMTSIGIDPLLGHDADILDRYVQAISKNKDVVYAVYLDRKRRILTHFSPEPKSTKNLMNIILPVELNGNRLGTVKLGLSKKSVQEQMLLLEDSVSTTVEMQKEGMADRLRITENFISKIITRVIVVFVCATIVISIVLIVLISLVGRKIIIRPIKELSSATHGLLMGDMTARVSSGKVLKCWEIKRCGEENCPAFDDTIRPCWHISDTRCPSCIEGGYAKKIENCRKCEVYKRISGDEIQELSDSFNVMAISINEHIFGLHKTEKKLRQQGQLLQTILDTIPDFVSLQDQRAVYKSVNKAFCNIVGKKEDEIVGKTNSDLFQRGLAETYNQEDLAILSTGNPLVKEDKVSSTKVKKWLHVVKIPVFEEDGTVVGLLCSGRDITELKRVQEHLTQSQKMEAVGQLTAGIAHEINTPLGIILGYTQLLLDDVEPESQVHEDLKTIEKHSKICRKIVSDLLRFSRHTESTITLLDINQSIEDSVKVMEHSFKLDMITINRNYGLNLPNIKGDKDKFGQILINLLGNAHNAIGTHGTISIKTSYDKQNDELIILVGDTGSGISSEKIDRIFDPFYTTKSVGKGTGLGLSVTFGIIKDLGGSIGVESPPSNTINNEFKSPQSTVFIIRFPVLSDGELSIT